MVMASRVKETAICSNSMVVAIGALALLVSTVAASPLELEEEQSENSLVGRPDPNVGDMVEPWDGIDETALRKLLVQLDDDRLERVGRSWPQSQPRGWGIRSLNGQLPRQWRTDKRQVRFRQCYFNPISCFRK